VSTQEDNARGVNAYLCLECDETKEEPRENPRTGWRMVETNIDIADEFVRMTILESGTGRIVYSARHSKRDGIQPHA
jgi:hypothetical protein